MNACAQLLARPGRRLLLAAGFLLVPVAMADFDLSWFTIDGGGDMWTTGGNFELSGTIGQPDASAVAMTGGSFELVGGFWPWTAGPGVPGDCDGNGFVDFNDFGVLADCMGGPAVNAPPGCVCVDMDNDGDVDVADFAEFQAAFLPP